MGHVVVRGARLEVQRIAPAAGGRGAPIIFLHEGLGSVAMWRDWPARLCEAAGREGIAYSRRGYGNSAPIPDVRGTGRLQPDYMHREAFEVLPELLSALDVTVPPVLVGHSDGGTIALLHASRFPVEACVVMAPHVIVEDVSVRAIEEAREAFLHGDLRARLSRYHADVDCAFWQWNDIWLSEAFRTSFDIRPDCHSIRAPLMAIQGRDDPYGSLRQIDDIVPSEGRIERNVIDRCGHSPHRHTESRIHAHISKFLARA